MGCKTLGLEPLTPLVTRLQKCNLDIYKVFRMTDNVTSKLKDFRDNVNIEFEHWFNFAVKLGEEVSRVPSVQRLAKGWSRFRPNIENDGSLSYYKGSLAISFPDDINSQLENRLKDRNHIAIFKISSRNYSEDFIRKIS